MPLLARPHARSLNTLTPPMLSSSSFGPDPCTRTTAGKRTRPLGYRQRARKGRRGAHRYGSLLEFSWVCIRRGGPRDRRILEEQACDVVAGVVNDFDDETPAVEAAGRKGCPEPLFAFEVQALDGLPAANLLLDRLPGLGELAWRKPGPHHTPEVTRRPLKIAVRRRG